MGSVGHAGHPENRLGLRWAEQISPTRARLLFGASFVQMVGEVGETYRVVSPTDPDFQMGVRATKASVVAEDDGPFPPNWGGKRFQRFTVIIEFPKSLKPGHRYGVQAMGMKGQPVTGGRAAHWIMPAGTQPPEEATANRLGLRSIEIIAPDSILLTLGAGVFTPPQTVKPEPRKPVYSVDFEEGVPKSWQAYKEVTDGLPQGNRRAIQAAHLIQWNGSIMAQDFQQGGVFTADADTAEIRFDYLAEDASSLSVRLGMEGRIVLREMKELVLGRWATTTLPLSEFHDEKEPKPRAQGPLAVGVLQFVAFKGKGTPRLLVDNIRVSSSPPRLVGDSPPHGPSLYILRSPDDPGFKSSRPATKMGRRSRVEAYLTEGWPYSTFKKHEVFLQFDRSLKEGKTYTMDLNAGSFPITCGESKGQLRFSSQSSINPCIKVNQLGYLPKAPAKFGYIGAWMGSLGTLDLLFLEKSEFEVRDAKSHAIVLKSQPKLRLKHTFELAPDGSLLPPGAKGKETVYAQDLSYEDLYEFDLAPLRQDGRYYVAISGMGRSFDFRIGADLYEEAYAACIRGVFHQRCGIEMKEPFTTHYRPVCHRNMTEWTDLNHGSAQDDFRNLPKHVIDEEKRDLFGGHHDAGDYNPRSHLDVVELLLMAYEMTPSHYNDNQNNIPESGNGIPDILDEARWGLDLWLRLQDEDGGVRNGTESDGDPDMITTAEMDTKRDFAFAKSARGSLRFAGVAAQASLIWASMKKEADTAKFRKRAKSAYDWAQENDAPSYPDDMVLAAIQLYRATGEKRYLDDFHTQSVFAKQDKPDLEVYQKYDQQMASFYYAFCQQPVEERIRSKILDAFKSRMAVWIQYAETTGYRFMRHPWAPNTWGTGAYPHWLVTPMQAYTLLEEPEYLKWIILTCDFSLGCHPMNTVFTVGLGQRSISGPLHIYGRYSPDGPITGTQCEGPSPRTGGATPGMSLSSWIDASLFPPGPWPQLHTYCDVEFCPDMCEGVVPTMAKTAIAYGFLIQKTLGGKR